MASNLQAVEHNPQPVQISSLITISTEPLLAFLLSMAKHPTAIHFLHLVHLSWSIYNRGKPGPSKFQILGVVV